MTTHRAGEQSVTIPVDGGGIIGDQTLPEGAKAMVLFAHGSGSSRRSPRNRSVAATLQAAGLATMLVDLLTPAEEAEDDRTMRVRFDIDLLAGRTRATLRRLHEDDATKALCVGVFGASTGAAAALIAAAQEPDYVDAVVSRGGRPDLASAYLGRVRAPTLLIVGGDDVEVLDLNRRALALLGFEKQLHVVPGATHLFEEPGALDEVARVACDWFTEHLVGKLP